MIDVYLASLFNLRKITVETSTEFKKLLDGTVEALHSLEALERPTKQ